MDIKLCTNYYYYWIVHRVQWKKIKNTKIQEKMHQNLFWRP